MSLPVKLGIILAMTAGAVHGLAGILYDKLTPARARHAQPAPKREAHDGLSGQHPTQLLETFPQ